MKALRQEKKSSLRCFFSCVICIQKLFQSSKMVKKEILVAPNTTFLLQNRFSRLWYEVLTQCFWDAIRCPPPLKTHVWLGVESCVHVGNCILQLRWEPWGSGFLIEEFCWRSCGDAAEMENCWEGPELSCQHNAQSLNAPTAQSKSDACKLKGLVGEGAAACARPVSLPSKRQRYSGTDTGRHYCGEKVVVSTI